VGNEERKPFGKLRTAKNSEKGPAAMCRCPTLTWRRKQHNGGKEAKKEDVKEKGADMPPN